MYYAASIFEMSNFDETTSIWLSGFTALAQVLGVGMSLFLLKYSLISNCVFFIIVLHYSPNSLFTISLRTH